MFIRGHMKYLKLALLGLSLSFAGYALAAPVFSFACPSTVTCKSSNGGMFPNDCQPSQYISYDWQLAATVNNPQDNKTYSFNSAYNFSLKGFSQGGMCEYTNGNSSLLFSINPVKAAWNASQENCDSTNPMQCLFVPVL